MNRQAYIDLEGNVYEIGHGKGEGCDRWMTFQRKSGDTPRFKVLSVWLPIRDTAEQAQADLKAWAGRAGFRKLQTCRVCGCTDDNCRGCIERMMSLQRVKLETPAFTWASMEPTRAWRRRGRIISSGIWYYLWRPADMDKIVEVLRRKVGLNEH